MAENERNNAAQESAPMSEKPDIDKLISEADISMYITKAAKKKRLVGLK